MGAELDSLPMLFGKYGPKGEVAYTIGQVADKDPSYLRWACENVDMDRWPGLFKCIHEALARRGELNN